MGEKFQNGVSEREIKRIINSSRTMILHESLHWNEQDHVNFCPFSIEHDVWMWNRLPKVDIGLSPEDILTGQKKIK